MLKPGIEEMEEMVEDAIRSARSFEEAGQRLAQELVIRGLVPKPPSITIEPEGDQLRVTVTLE